MEIFREEEFYKKEGYPTEYLYYCDYWFIVSDGTPDYGRDYDQFALDARGQVSGICLN